MREQWLSSRAGDTTRVGLERLVIPGLHVTLQRCTSCGGMLYCSRAKDTDCHGAGSQDPSETLGFPRSYTKHQGVPRTEFHSLVLAFVCCVQRGDPVCGCPDLACSTPRMEDRTLGSNTFFFPLDLNPRPPDAQSEWQQSCAPQTGLRTKLYRDTQWDSLAKGRTAWQKVVLRRSWPHENRHTANHDGSIHGAPLMNVSLAHCRHCPCQEDCR